MSYRELVAELARANNLTVLLMPTWLVLGVPGGLLAILARPRKRRRFARSRD